MSEPKSPEQKAHILIHAEGAGVPSPELVEQRARELAVIAGRPASSYSDEDFRQAKREIMEQFEPEADEMEESTLEFEPGSGDVQGGRPSQAVNYGSNDESSVGEELVQEGLDEALHDEMLEASKRNIREGSL